MPPLDCEVRNPGANARDRRRFPGFCRLADKGQPKICRASGTWPICAARQAAHNGGDGSFFNAQIRIAQVAAPNACRRCAHAACGVVRLRRHCGSLDTTAGDFRPAGGRGFPRRPAARPGTSGRPTNGRTDQHRMLDALRRRQPSARHRRPPRLCETLCRRTHAAALMPAAKSKAARPGGDARHDFAPFGGLTRPFDCRLRRLPPAQTRAVKIARFGACARRSSPEFSSP